jgi:tripartite-type tricarboxylate transporter receptor subunit TctC
VLCVPAALPVKSVAEFVAYAKANAGKLSYAGTSRGSVTHLSTEMFKRATGAEMEFIGYAGIPPALTDLIGGRLQFMSVGIVAAMPQITAGKIRPLAVLDAERHPLLPDVPSIVEAGLSRRPRQHVVRACSSRADAARNRPGAQCGNDEDRPRAGSRREVQGDGRESDRAEHAGAVRRVP